MKKEPDFANDLAEIRSMMERSSRIRYISGWAGIITGVLALIAMYIAYTTFHFRPTTLIPSALEVTPDALSKTILLAAVLLFISLIIAFSLSIHRATQRKEPYWNSTTRRLLTNAGLPLIVGGVLALLCWQNGLIGWLAPLTLLFYGLAMFNAAAFAFKELRYFGMIQVLLGILAAFFIPYALLLWAAGFGFMNIAYGIFIHIKYEK